MDVYFVFNNSCMKWSKLENANQGPTTASRRESDPKQTNVNDFSFPCKWRAQSAFQEPKNPPMSAQSQQCPLSLSFSISLSHTCQFSLLFSQPPIFCTHQLSTWHGTTPPSGPYCINKQRFSLRPPSNVCTSDKKILGWSRGLGFMSQTQIHTPPNQFLVKICNTGLVS